MSIPTSGGISESDAAFYSFACVMMCIYLVPASLFTSYRIWKKPKKAFTPAFSLHVLALAMLMYAVWYCFQQLQNVDTFGVFDPYEILKISDSSSLSEIKKAYRKMSKRLHPDKNRHNPHATAQFARIVKAYEALTDPMGIENYRKYGHPDGKQSLLMNVAFFSFPSGSSGSGGFFVLIYFALMIGFILWIVFYVIKSGKRKDKSQVSRKTLQSFADILNERMSVLDILELLLSCDEMTFAEDHELLEIQQREKTHLKLLKKMSAAKALPGEVTNRIKDTINPVARENLIAIYYFLRHKKLKDISQPSWLLPRLIKVRMDLPYIVEIFSQLAAKESVRRGYQALTFTRALSLFSSLAQGNFVADDDALSEQRSRFPKGFQPELALDNVKFFVADEPNIQPGDWITVEMSILRKHVQPEELAPLAFTRYEEINPNFPFRKENLWITVTDKGSNRLYAAWKCLDLGRHIQQSTVFEGPGIAGEYEMEIRITNTCYLGVEAVKAVALKMEK